MSGIQLPRRRRRLLLFSVVAAVLAAWASWLPPLGAPQAVGYSF